MTESRSTERGVIGLASGSLLRPIADRTPAGVRRICAGAWLDVSSLPARLRDPGRWNEPWQTFHNVGGGDFRASGEAILRQLVDIAGLRRDWRVLDIGCGTGRAAAPLAEFLAPEGGYVGFDVSRIAVDSCRRRFRRRRPDFAFHHADVANPVYNVRGSAAPEQYVFPCPDQSIDLAFATSVFTHLRLPVVARQLRESARALKPGGRFLFTAYTLIPGRGEPALSPFEPGVMVLDPKAPERAIAFDETLLRAVVAEAGLGVIEPVRLGAWLGEATYEGGQDLWLVEKPVR